MLKTKLFMLLGLLLVLALGACAEITPTPSTPSEQFLSGDLVVQNFQSEREFIEFLDGAGSSGAYGVGSFMRGGSMEVADVAFNDMAMDSAPMPTSALDKSSLDYSETNVQVAGIDELDIIKTDGEYIYTSSNKNLFIIKSYPASDAEIVYSVSLENTITGLFIEDDVLAVVGRVDDFSELEDSGFSSRNQFTFIEFYDVSDKENPRLLKEYKFDGSYFNARMYDGFVYLSTNYNPFMRPSPFPIIMVDGVSRTMPVSDIYFYNADYNNPSFVSIHSLSMASQENVDSKVLTLEGSNYLYMSQNNIYLTFRETINRYELQQQFTIDEVLPLLPIADKEFIDRIKGVDDDILNKYEKQSKILQVIQSYLMFLDESERERLIGTIEKNVKEEMKKLGVLEYTAINKISVDSGELSFVAGNKVPGNVYGQFALDEQDGFLRVATTISAGMMINDEYDGFSWQSRSPSSNNVYVLDDDLSIVGELEGLAPTESVFSARYVDDRLYLVTFRQIDPFFVIDLSDPRNPKDLGELKITGYSRYLHPFDENTIIGIGREGTETGRILGIKISLFDVSDVKNPVELVTYVSDDARSSSGAEWEHKAFLFSRERELLVIPAQNHDFRNPENNYAGALVFKINKEEITPRGIIDHSSGARYSGGVERSLFIEDELYTKSLNLLRINNLKTLASTKNITLSVDFEGGIPKY